MATTTIRYDLRQVATFSMISTAPIATLRYSSGLPVGTMLGTVAWASDEPERAQSNDRSTQKHHPVSVGLSVRTNFLQFSHFARELLK